MVILQKLHNLANFVVKLAKKLSLFDKFSERHSFILGGFSGSLSHMLPEIMVPATAAIFLAAMGIKTEKLRRLGVTKTKGLKEVIKDPWYFAGAWMIAFYLLQVV